MESSTLTPHRRWTIDWRLVGIVLVSEATAIFLAYMIINVPLVGPKLTRSEALVHWPAAVIGAIVVVLGVLFVVRETQRARRQDPAPVVDVVEDEADRPGCRARFASSACRAGRWHWPPPSRWPRSQWDTCWRSACRCGGLRSSLSARPPYLHYTYNVIVFLPMVIALWDEARRVDSGRFGRRKAGGCGLSLAGRVDLEAGAAGEVPDGVARRVRVEGAALGSQEVIGGRRRLDTDDVVVAQAGRRTK